MEYTALKSRYVYYIVLIYVSSQDTFYRSHLGGSNAYIKLRMYHLLGNVLRDGNANFSKVVV